MKPYMIVLSLHSLHRLPLQPQHILLHADRDHGHATDRQELGRGETDAARFEKDVQHKEDQKGDEHPHGEVHVIGARGVHDHAVVGGPQVGASREDDSDDECAFGQS